MERKEKRKQETNSIKCDFSCSSVSNEEASLTAPKNNKHSRKASLKKDVMTADLFFVLDRSNISDRQAFFVLYSAAKALDHYLDEL